MFAQNCVCLLLLIDNRTVFLNLAVYFNIFERPFRCRLSQEWCRWVTGCWFVTAVLTSCMHSPPWAGCAINECSYVLTETALPPETSGNWSLAPSLICVMICTAFFLILSWYSIFAVSSDLQFILRSLQLYLFPRFKATKMKETEPSACGDHVGLWRLY
jgi:hypothetical protein